MPRVARVAAREILDSRGWPTVEADVVLHSGASGRAAVPSGASTGDAEAIELRDGDGARYLKKGVRKAVENIRTVLAPRVVGLRATDQRHIDTVLREADGTPNKEVLGANAVLAVSLAVAKAGAAHVGLPLYRYLGGVDAHLLPMPYLNIVNGGAHASNNIDVQEFMVVPIGAADYSEALRMAVETYHALRGLLNGRGLGTGLGDEGGFAPNLRENREALELIVEAIEAAGFSPGVEIGLAMDVAASEFFDRESGSYHLAGEGRTLSSQGLVELYASWLECFPFIVSIEDGCSEHDREGWIHMTRTLGSQVQLVGDDLFVTNPSLLEAGIRDGLANSILIKPNQIGTLTETLETIQVARKGNYKAMISHRSGETEDTTIADLAVATGVGQIKTGAPCRTDRVCKYNQLLRIEEELGSVASFPGAVK